MCRAFFIGGMLGSGLVACASKAFRFDINMKSLLEATVPWAICKSLVDYHLI